MVLDHLVKERYPRFIDSLRDMDDCLCMIHLFAALPSVGRITAERTSACARLAREWQYFVSKSRSLRKVFVSVKGIYYQAEIMGETINWLVPHAFTQHIPPAVDFRVMVTFMEFYEIFFKFVLYKLYSKQGWQYPPVVDAQLEHSGCCLLAMKTDSTTPATTATTNAPANGDEKKKASQSSSDSALVTAVDHKEFEGKVKSLPSLLKNLATEEADSEDEEDELDISAPLSAAFSDLQRSAGDNDDDETDREIFQRNQEAASENQRLNLFSKLTFYINREVPLSVMQLCLTAFGARVSWDGPGAPFKSDDRSITHHIVDRPVQGQSAAPREYIQPQWVFDSINAGVLLPTRLYAPGAKLPPHLSPFVDDEKEGYLPRYREEVQKLQIEAGVLEVPTGVTSTAASTDKKKKDTKQEAAAAAGKKRAAIDMDEDEEEEDSSAEEDEEDDYDEEDEDSDDDEEEDSEEEEEAEELLEVPSKNNKKAAAAVASSSTKKQAAEESSKNKKGPKAIVQKAKGNKQTEVGLSLVHLHFLLCIFCFRSKGSFTFADIHCRFRVILFHLWSLVAKQEACEMKEKSRWKYCTIE